MARPEVEGLSGGRKAMYLRGKQAEIADHWWKEGTAATLLEFGIGQMDVLRRVLERVGITLRLGWEGYLGGGYPRLPISGDGLTSAKRGKNAMIYYLDNSELMELQDPYHLTGTAKRHWMYLHRDEIIEFYRGHSFDDTCAKYHLGVQTFVRFLGMPHDKKGRVQWKSAIPAPRDHIERQLDIVKARYLEEIELGKANRKDTRNILEFLQLLVQVLDQAFPQIGVTALIRQNQDKLPPSLLQLPELLIKRSGYVPSPERWR
jgi:hypothetical protein